MTVLGDVSTVACPMVDFIRSIRNTFFNVSLPFVVGVCEVLTVFTLGAYIFILLSRTFFLPIEFEKATEKPCRVEMNVEGNPSGKNENGKWNFGENFPQRQKKKKNPLKSETREYNDIFRKSFVCRRKPSSATVILRRWTERVRWQVGKTRPEDVGPPEKTLYLRASRRRVEARQVCGEDNRILHRLYVTDRLLLFHLTFRLDGGPLKTLYARINSRLLFLWKSLCFFFFVLSQSKPPKKSCFNVFVSAANHP